MRIGRPLRLFLHRNETLSFAAQSRLLQRQDKARFICQTHIRGARSAHANFAQLVHPDKTINLSNTIKNLYAGITRC